MIDADEQRRSTGVVPAAGAESITNPAALASLGTNEAIEDWLRTHRELILLETAFTELALKSVAGEVPIAELSRQRDILEAMRELCRAAYLRAFPNGSARRNA